ncbi:putative MFS-type transporter C18,02 [Talaromyces islandicus]|uniref:Putative MFS-type transporter C18,02 n=1 Tax=Talaromyces islandicus TaxID=28573 RepID=A0A0U1LMA2_TALIS|nr:putative MFS-type transporter C18,02 [Talaromyces islandicus]
MAPIPAMDNAKQQQPWSDFRSSKAFIVIVVSIAIFADVFIYGMVIPLIPTILRDRLNLPDDQLQKWLSILLATFGGALLLSSPVIGYFADKGSSRKPPFVIGLIAVAGSTVMLWMARTPTAMIVARVLQGVADAAMWTVGNALVVDTVEKEQLGSAMGYVSMSMTVGTMAGPALGGILLDQAGYDSVFILALVMIGIDIVFRCLMIEPQSKKALRDRVDSEKDPLLARAGQPSYQATTGDEEQASPGRHHVVSTSSLPPIVRLAMSGQLLVVLLASIVDGALWTSFESTIPVFVIKTFGWDSFEIGMSFFALTIPAIISPIVGYAIDRYGPRVVSSLSFASLMPIFIAFRFVTDDSLQSRIMFIALLVTTGFSFSAVLLPLMVEISEPIERQEREFPGTFGDAGASGQVYGLHSSAWACGTLLGPILAGALVETVGWKAMNLVLAAMSGGTAVLLVSTDDKVGQLVWRAWRAVAGFLGLSSGLNSRAGN